MGELFPTSVYLLCLFTSTACAALLARQYRQTRMRLLLWSALSFFFLACNNLAVVLDLLVFSSTDLRLPRLLTSLAAVGVLIFGFIWDSEG